MPTRHVQPHPLSPLDNARGKPSPLTERGNSDRRRPSRSEVKRSPRDARRGAIPDRVRRGIPRALLRWYDRHGRDLPWRRVSDPYHFLVAEYMLQQTQVSRVVDYYDRFLLRYPTVERLARARAQTVRESWEGLGYYARARNLHSAAQMIVREHGGRVPDTEPALRRLPGVGRYTANALLSIAHAQDCGTVDANIARVFSRLFAVKPPLKTAAAQRRLWSIAEALAPRGRAGDFNQALMDLGATVCVPRRPRCPECPVRRWCALGNRSG